MLLFQSKRSEEGSMQPGPGEDVLHLDPRRIADCHKFRSEAVYRRYSFYCKVKTGPLKKTE